MDALLTRTTLGMDPMDGKERKQETTEEEANLGRRPTASANPHGLVCWAAITQQTGWLKLQKLLLHNSAGLKSDQCQQIWFLLRPLSLACRSLTSSSVISVFLLCVSVLELLRWRRSLMPTTLANQRPG